MPNPAWSPSKLPDASDPSLSVAAGVAGAIAPSGIASAEAFGALTVAVSSISNPQTIMGANMLARFRGDSGLTATGWADMTANGNNLAGNCTVVAAALGGINGAKFVAASSNKFTKTVTVPARTSTPCFFWGVVRQDAWAISGRLCGGSVSAGICTVLQSSTGASPVCAIYDGGGAQSPNNSAAAISSFKRLEAGFTASVSDYLKLGATSLGGANTGGTVPGDQIALAFNNGSYGDVTWLEFGWMNVIPSGTQLTALDAYVTATYGAGLV